MVLKTETLGKVDHNHPVSFEMWCCRRMEKISWTDRVRNVEVLHRVKEERNILHTLQIRKANRIGHKYGKQTGLVTSYGGTAF